MIRRTTWVILAIFIVLVGLAWYLQRNPLKTATASPTPTLALNLFEVQENTISSLKVESSKGKQVALGRDANGAWALTEPKADATDTGQAEQAMSQLVSLAVVTSLSTPPPLADVGLASPAYTITVVTNGGPKLVAKVGSQTAVGSGYYTQVNDGPVVIASKNGLDALVSLLDNPPILKTPTPTGGAATSLPGTPPAGAPGSGTPAVEAATTAPETITGTVVTTPAATTPAAMTPVATP